MKNKKKIKEFLKDKQVILLIAFILISIISVAALGIDEGLDLKGEYSHPVTIR